MRREKKKDNVIEVKEDVRLPNTDIILEVGDKIRILERKPFDPERPAVAFRRKLGMDRDDIIDVLERKRISDDVHFLPFEDMFVFNVDNESEINRAIKVLRDVGIEAFEYVKENKSNKAKNSAKSLNIDMFTDYDVHVSSDNKGMYFSYMGDNQQEGEYLAQDMNDPLLDSVIDQVNKELSVTLSDELNFQRSKEYSDTTLFIPWK